MLEITEKFQSIVCIRTPQRGDGPAIWSLVRDCGVLSLNSAYAYVLMADMFAATCAVAESTDRMVGAVVGFRPPSRPRAWFVWQIGVHPSARGAGLGARMLAAVLARADNRDVHELLTTVSPGNDPSERTFRALARRHAARIEVVDTYPADLFPDSTDAENVLRITGLNTQTSEHAPCY